MPVQLFINFNGNCKKAVEYYARVFGLEKPKMTAFEEMPMEMGELPANLKKLIGHTSLVIHGQRIMFSDVPPEAGFVLGNNISITIVSKDMNEIKTLFNKLKVGGYIIMDLQETFWSKCYGYLVDKFGIPWQLSYDSEENGMK